MQQLMNERFRKLRQDVDEMRKLLIEATSKKQRRLKRKYKRLRQSLPAGEEEGEGEEEDENLSQTAGEAKLQLERESRGGNSSKTSLPPTFWVRVADVLAVALLVNAAFPPPALVLEDQDMLPAPPLMDEDEVLSPPALTVAEKLDDGGVLWPPTAAERPADGKAVAAATPASVAPVAHMVSASSNSIPARTPAPTGSMKPQRAKCSVKRGKPRGGMASSSRAVQKTETVAVSPLASRTGVGMAKRSKLARGTTSVSRAEAEASRVEQDDPEKAPARKAASFTPVNRESLGTSLLLKSDGKGGTSKPTEATPKLGKDPEIVFAAVTPVFSTGPLAPGWLGKCRPGCLVGLI
jgi:hypothetical protein